MLPSFSHCQCKKAYSHISKLKKVKVKYSYIIYIEPLDFIKVIVYKNENFENMCFFLYIGRYLFLLVHNLVYLPWKSHVCKNVYLAHAHVTALIKYKQRIWRLRIAVDSAIFASWIFIGTPNDRYKINIASLICAPFTEF